MELLMGTQVFPTLDATPPAPAVLDKPGPATQSHQPLKLKEMPPAAGRCGLGRGGIGVFMLSHRSCECHASPILVPAITATDP